MGDKLINIDLFEKLTPDIKEDILSHGLNNETSEDHSQDVFIRMAENYADKKESKKNRRSLMYEVARNVRNDHFRRLYRIPKLQSLEEAEYYLADNVEVESTVLKNLESSELKDKIDLLPPLKQKIFSFAWTK